MRLVSIITIASVLLLAGAAQAAVGENIVAGITTGAAAPNITYGVWTQNGNPNNLTDGNLTNSYDHWGDANTAPWWKIDWVDDTPVSQIKIYGRTGYAARMINATVMLFDSTDTMLLQEVIDSSEIVNEDHSGVRPTWTFDLATPILASSIYLDGKSYLTGASIDRNVLAISEVQVIEGILLPEPATMSLLVLGGLTALIRRKK
ncbi:MAG: PEP-CTERM sorting domain-containing protein [Planctomycetaceae bacterium]|nr:PEP-CTERM sorting domain-containing protein [Planctomycetaceae bacterium]